MTYSDFDSNDLRYLQCADFTPGPVLSWSPSRNPFEQRMARNLRPGHWLRLNLETSVRVIASAVREHHRSQILIFDTLLQGESPSIAFISSYAGMPSICADVAGNLLPALHWYRMRGETALRIAVCRGDFFWFPLNPSGGTHESV